jgi:hypothetical protein
MQFDVKIDDINEEVKFVEQKIQDIGFKSGIFEMNLSR